MNPSFKRAESFDGESATQINERFRRRSLKDITAVQDGDSLWLIRAKGIDSTIGKFKVKGSAFGSTSCLVLPTIRVCEMDDHHETWRNAGEEVLLAQASLGLDGSPGNFTLAFTDELSALMYMEACLQFGIQSYN